MVASFISVSDLTARGYANDFAIKLGRMVLAFCCDSLVQRPRTISIIPRCLLLITMGPKKSTAAMIAACSDASWRRLGSG